MNGLNNTAKKVRAILEVVPPEGKISGKEIANRLEVKGYKAETGNINMFIYYHMLHKYLKKVKIDGINHYHHIN